MQDITEFFIIGQKRRVSDFITQPSKGDEHLYVFD
jgi:hypothetical protein